MSAGITRTGTVPTDVKLRWSATFPKCTLFDEWLPGEYLKCEKCMAAVAASRRSHEPIPLKELREINEPTPVWWAEAGFWCLIQNGILTAPSGMSAQVNEMSGTFYFCQPEEG